MKTQRQVLISRFEIIAFLICCIFFMSLFNHPVTANITNNSSINVTFVNENSITWQYEYLNTNKPIGALFDGVEIEGFNTQFSGNYIAKELEKNSSHIFCLYDSATINCETGTTTIPKEYNLINVIIPYSLFIFGCLIVLIGIKVPFVAFIAWFIALAGLKLNNTGDINVSVAYLLLFVAATFIGFLKFKGDD